MSLGKLQEDKTIDVVQTSYSDFPEMYNRYIEDNLSNEIKKMAVVNWMTKALHWKKSWRRSSRSGQKTVDDDIHINIVHTFLNWKKLY